MQHSVNRESLLYRIKILWMQPNTKTIPLILDAPEPWKLSLHRWSVCKKKSAALSIVKERKNSPLWAFLFCLTFVVILLQCFPIEYVLIYLNVMRCSCIIAQRRRKWDLVYVKQWMTRWRYHLYSLCIETEPSLNSFQMYIFYH